MKTKRISELFDYGDDIALGIEEASEDTMKIRRRTHEMIVCGASQNAGTNEVKRSAWKIAIAAALAVLLIVGAGLALYFGGMRGSLSANGENNNNNGNVASSETAAKENTGETITEKPNNSGSVEPNETETIEIIEETSGDACLVEGWTLEKSIDAAPVIFEGVCLSKERYEPQGLPDMYFRVDKVYRGDINAGDEINVMAIDFGAYGVGSSYILMTIPQASVFSGKELYYQADTTIGLINGLCDGILPDVDGTGRGETEERIEAYIAGHPYTGDTAVLYEYCTSDDLMEIAEFSDQVALVSADGIFVNEGDRTVYNCTVETCFKGQARGKIRVITFKNGMEIGEKYLVLVSNASSDQPLYIMSSQRSLLRADSPEATELMDKLK